MGHFLRKFDPTITFIISSLSPFLKGRWEDHLIFIRPLCLIFTIFFSYHCYAEDTSETLTLSEGLRLATDNNHLIKIASFNKSIASADTSIARSGLLPSINASLTQSYLARQPGARFGSLNAFLAEKDSLSYGINIYQTIYDFGANISRYEASKTNLDLSKLDLVRVKNLVALDFINAYFDLLETEKMVLVAEKEVERFTLHLKVTQSFYEEGVITKNDLLQAEVMLSDARQRLLTMKNRRSFNASNINSILARPIYARVQVVDVPANISHVVELEKAWDTAGKERSEIKMTDNQLKILNFQETAARSEYYPTLFAQGGYNYTENRYQFPSDNWSLIFGVHLNVFSGGSTKAGVSKVLYEKEQLLEQKKKLIDDINLEVEKSYLDLKNALEKIQVTKDAVSQGEENLRINKIRYEEGVGTSTDVVDAITLLTTAETNYYRAVYELQRAGAGLRYAMGLDLVSTYSY
jgi:outer membrane protein TolC